jgi:hypothetical protein
MYKFRRRRQSYYSSPYSKNGKFGQGLKSLSWYLLGAGIVLILVELLLRIFVGISGNGKKFDAYRGEPPEITAYNLQFVDNNKKPLSGFANVGSLLAQKSSATGYKLLGNQKNERWQINEQGFRDTKAVPLAKPANEFRIFIVGGSTAFGQWNANNTATISSKLESRLNSRVKQQKQSPEKYRPDLLPAYGPELFKALNLPIKIKDYQYRVINAAVPGYTSGNELPEVLLQILNYKPDLLVVVNGYGDLMLPSDKNQTEIPHIEDFLNNAPGHFLAYLGNGTLQSLQSTYMVKAFQSWIFKPKPSANETSLLLSPNNSLINSLPQDDAELKRRINRYYQNTQKLVTFCAQGGIPLIIGFQPEITGNKNKKLDPSEQKVIDELGQEYVQKIAGTYPKFLDSLKPLEKKFPQNVNILNFYNTTDLPAPSFIDAVHLTDKGNGAIAEKLYNKISNLPKLKFEFKKNNGKPN